LQRGKLGRHCKPIVLRLLPINDDNWNAAVGFLEKTGGSSSQII
jgi:hypothetical protein